MVTGELIDDGLTFWHPNPQPWKQNLLFGAKVKDEISVEEIPKLLSTLPQTSQAHRLDLPQGLLSASQRQSQTVVVVV
jgi:hypothetical protein